MFFRRKKKDQDEIEYTFPGSNNKVKLTREEYESLINPTPKAHEEEDAEEKELTFEDHNREYIEALKAGNLSRARNEMLSMAQIRDKEKAFRDAIALYIGVFAYDCWGIDNPGFAPDPYIAPRIVNRIKTLARKNGLTSDVIKKMFYDRFSAETWPAHSPVTKIQAYNLLQKALVEGVDAANEDLAKKAKSYAKKNGLTQI